MIIKSLGGRGNQLYCYALARSIKLNYPKYKVTLDTRNFFKNDKFRRTNQLSGLTNNLDKPLTLSIFY